jgi:hypothetical protein
VIGEVKYDLRALHLDDQCRKQVSRNTLRLGRSDHRQEPKKIPVNRSQSGRRGQWAWEFGYPADAFYAPDQFPKRFPGLLWAYAGGQERVSLVEPQPLEVLTPRQFFPQGARQQSLFVRVRPDVLEFFDVEKLAIFSKQILIKGIDAADNPPQSAFRVIDAKRLDEPPPDGQPSATGFFPPAGALC